MNAAELHTLCRDCLSTNTGGGQRCRLCGSPRVLHHAELHNLSIAHIDCDAFYASVEKRDNPKIRDKPVIVGGGHRGVVAAACYLARMYGVRSAMPMFQALKACPDAVVIRPNMRKYAAVGQNVRAIMEEYTPLIQPISIDEAFLDLSGTEKLHNGSPATTLARIVRRLDAELGVPASIGLSYNKFLAKIASDLDKPKGFAIIGSAEARSFLSAKPVRFIWGVGKALENKLHRNGIQTIGDLQTREKMELVAKFGAIGERLYYFSRGEDNRRVNPERETKSVSAETTFATDISNFDTLKRRVWPLCEKVSDRLRAKDLNGHTVTIKLKTSSFKQITRQQRLENPTQSADLIYKTAATLIEPEATGTNFRLIGVGVADFEDPVLDDQPDLLGPGTTRQDQIEDALNKVRTKIGANAIIRGRSL